MAQGWGSSWCALALVPWLAAGPALAETPPWAWDAELGATYDSNSGNAGTEDDRRETERVSGGIGATRTSRLSDFTALQWRAGADAEADLRQKDLSFARGGLRLRLLNRAGEGFYAPLLGVSAGASYKASASRLRSGDELRIGAYLSEPLTTQVSTRLAWDWKRKNTASRAFDGQNRGYELSVDWAVLPSLTVYGQYRYETGPIVVTADASDGAVTPKSEHLVLVNVADAVERDEAFGDGWFAFRVSARTQVATLGANVPLTRDVSLDAQLRRAHASVSYDAYYNSSSPGGPPVTFYGAPGYDRWLGGLGLLMRF